MNPKATIICHANDFETIGELPDGKPIEYLYNSERGELDQKLVEQLQKHHYDTSIQTSEGRKFGHTSFDVFFNDNTTGHIDGSSYCVTFKRNKER
jgi:hypothetical protein